MPTDLQPMNDQVAAAAAAIRRLRPPAGASEAWVRERGVAITAIAEAGGLDRPALIAALFEAGVAQRSDRSRPLGGTAVSRALSVGRKANENRQTGIDLQKIEAAITKVVAGLLPGVTEKIARQAAAEALRLAAHDGRTAAVQTPAATLSTAAEPAPALETAPEIPARRPNLTDAARLLQNVDARRPADLTRADLLFPTAATKGIQK